MSPAARPVRRRRSGSRQKRRSPSFAATRIVTAIISMAVVGLFPLWFTSDYTVSLQSPNRMHFQWPVVIEKRIDSLDAAQARADQHGRRLTAWQHYACRKFGSDCRVALAIQRAENPQGKCEIYHYNSDGTLDWGYFQINSHKPACHSSAIFGI